MILSLNTPPPYCQEKPSFLTFSEQHDSHLSVVKFHIHREGWPFIGGFLCLALLVFFYLKFVAIPLLVAALFCCFFFRVPHRIIPTEQNIILSPADGTVVEISEAIEPHFTKELRKKIGIFLSVFDVHVNRSPISGTIKNIRYQKGRFRFAFDKRASAQNEQNALLIEENGPTGRQQSYVVTQIAGTVARRIVCHVAPGDSLKMGDLFGIIRFGSRMDLYLPRHVKTEVVIGQKVQGGSSIVARIPS